MLGIWLTEEKKSLGIQPTVLANSIWLKKEFVIDRGLKGGNAPVWFFTEKLPKNLFSIDPYHGKIKTKSIHL